MATRKESQAVTILIDAGTLARDEWNQLRIVGRYCAVMTPYGAACRLEDDGWIWNDHQAAWVAPGAAAPLYVNLAGEETTPATIDGKYIVYNDHAGRPTYRMRFRRDDVQAVVVDGETWYEVDADRLWEDWHDVDDRAAVEP